MIASRSTGSSARRRCVCEHRRGSGRASCGSRARSCATAARPRPARCTRRDRSRRSSIPAASNASPRSISSVAIDLDFTDRAQRLRRRAMPRMIAPGVLRRRGPVHVHAQAREDGLERGRASRRGRRASRGGPRRPGPSSSGCTSRDVTRGEEAPVEVAQRVLQVGIGDRTGRAARASVVARA